MQALPAQPTQRPAFLGLLVQGREAGERYADRGRSSGDTRKVNEQCT